jgi:hypothetical protein
MMKQKIKKRLVIALAIVLVVIVLVVVNWAGISKAGEDFSKGLAAGLVSAK